MKKNPVPKPEIMSTCPDCGMTYTCSQSDHDLFCAARTCSMCLNSYPAVIPADGLGDRVCASCIRELDAGDYDRDSDREDDPETEEDPDAGS